MSLSRIRKPARVVLSLLLALLVLGAAPQTPAPAAQGGAIALKAPPFVASAQEGTDVTPAGFPEDEAGISAYFKAPGPIDFSQVRLAYRNLEVETVDYLIGSVAVPDYPETYDVHVYVQKDGWFLAYYLKADPGSKMFDWRDYYDHARPNMTTRLENTLARVSGFAAVTFPDASYYDFRYPNATHMMLITETVQGVTTDDFQVNIPVNYVLYERSWSTTTTNCRHYFYLDDVVISSSDGGCGWLYYEGTLTQAQLLPNKFHTFVVRAWNNGWVGGGVLLIYRVQ